MTLNQIHPFWESKAMLLSGHHPFQNCSQGRGLQTSSSPRHPLRWRAAGGIGQPLSLLVKMSPLVSVPHLYDIANVKGVAADLSHCNTPPQVLEFTGTSELANCLKGVDVVVTPTGVPVVTTLRNPPTRRRLMQPETYSTRQE